MSHIIFPLDSFPPVFILPRIILTLKIFKWFTLFAYVPYHFPQDSFCPHIILPQYYFAPWKLFNDLQYLPMPHIIFPLGFILPHIILSNSPHIIFPLEIAIVKWFTLFTHVLYHCPPGLILPPIILPPYYFAPRNCSIYTIYPCPTSFFPLIHFAPV